MVLGFWVCCEFYYESMDRSFVLDCFTDDHASLKVPVSIQEGNWQ